VEDSLDGFRIGDYVRSLQDGATGYWSTVTGRIIRFEDKDYSGSRIVVLADADACYLDGTPVKEVYRTAGFHARPSILELVPSSTCPECRTQFIIKGDYLCPDCREKR
jgi:hypothetical protein